MTTPVGIKAIEVYFPRNFVSHADLEAFDGVGAGKYTIGLGQEAMAFAEDCEDTVSICMTAAANLLEKNGVDPKSIGRVEVGTESLIDKSKSVKTGLMPLFASCGNFDVEGVDNINACYGGTAALLNSLTWAESEIAEGRDALVVCGDIAVYEKGAARPTGGCAAVAMLIGRGEDVAVRFDSVRASHFENAWDFYKPDLASEYPRVDGADSLKCYLRAVDGCFQRYALRFEKKFGAKFDLSAFDNIIFHSPFNKMVQKSVARLQFLDFLANPSAKGYETVQSFASLRAEDTYDNRDVEKAFTALSKPLYANKVEDGTLLPRVLGNSYTASLYTGLASLLHALNEKKVDVSGRRVGLFSYGSGLAATLFSATLSPRAHALASQLDLTRRLADRVASKPQDFTDALSEREKRYGSIGYVPSASTKSMFPGTFYLNAVDAQGRRTYGRTPARAFSTAASKILRVAKHL